MSTRSKPEQARTNQSNQRQPTSNFKQGNKAKPSPLRLISDTGRHSMALVDIQWLACN